MAARQREAVLENEAVIQDAAAVVILKKENNEVKRSGIKCRWKMAQRNEYNSFVLFCLLILLTKSVEFFII